MSSFTDLQDSTARLRQRADSADQALSDQAQADVVIEHPRRLYLRAPGGAYCQIGVSDGGVLTATNVGSTLP